MSNLSFITVHKPPALWKPKTSAGDYQSIGAMSRNENIFHLVLVLAVGQISDASPKRPDGYLVKTKLGKTYLGLGVSNKDKEIVNRNDRPHKGTKHKPTPHKWDEKPHKWNKKSHKWTPQTSPAKLDNPNNIGHIGHIGPIALCSYP